MDSPLLNSAEFQINITNNEYHAQSVQLIFEDDFVYPILNSFSTNLTSKYDNNNMP